MKNYVEEIRGKTSEMTTRERWTYIFTYYWYHILGLTAGAGMALFLIVHGAGLLTGAGRTDFTCVLVNQEIDYARDKEIRQRFAAAAKMEEKKIAVDSDYNISYGMVKLEGANESSYEKFFFRWRNRELDAVVLPESFYKYVTGLGGTWLALDGVETGELKLYEDGGKRIAVCIGETGLGAFLRNETGEPLLLAFPGNSRHPDACQDFLNFVMEL